MNTLLFSFASGEKLPHNQNNQTDPPTRKANGNQGRNCHEDEIGACVHLVLLRIAFAVEVNVKKPDEFRQNAEQRIEMEMSNDRSDSEKLNHREDGVGESDRLCLCFLHI